MAGSPIQLQPHGGHQLPYASQRLTPAFMFINCFTGWARSTSTLWITTQVIVRCKTARFQIGDLCQSNTYTCCSLRDLVAPASASNTKSNGDCRHTESCHEYQGAHPHPQCKAQLPRWTTELYCIYIYLAGSSTLPYLAIVDYVICQGTYCCRQEVISIYAHTYQSIEQVPCCTYFMLLAAQYS